MPMWTRCLSVLACSLALISAARAQIYVVLCGDGESSVRARQVSPYEIERYDKETGAAIPKQPMKAEKHRFEATAKKQGFDFVVLPSRHGKHEVIAAIDPVATGLLASRAQADMADEFAKSNAKLGALLDPAAFGDSAKLFCGLLARAHERTDDPNFPENPRVVVRLEKVLRARVEFQGEVRDVMFPLDESGNPENPVYDSAVQTESLLAGFNPLVTHGHSTGEYGGTVIVLPVNYMTPPLSAYEMMEVSHLLNSYVHDEHTKLRKQVERLVLEHRAQMQATLRDMRLVEGAMVGTAQISKNAMKHLCTRPGTAGNDALDVAMGTRVVGARVSLVLRVSVPGELRRNVFPDGSSSGRPVFSTYLDLGD